jgi:hypothetical protein
MAILFEHLPHPHVAARRTQSPPKMSDAPPTMNGRIAVRVTAIVGTMWCAYAFALLALVALPDALNSGAILPLIQWVSQTFIQLVMLSVIMVGQGILGRAADRRSEMTYNDAEAIFHETAQMQKHLDAQDEALDALLVKIAQLETTLAAKP